MGKISLVVPARRPPGSVGLSAACVETHSPKGLSACTNAHHWQSEDPPQELSSWNFRFPDAGRLRWRTARLTSEGLREIFRVSVESDISQTFARPETGIRGQVSCAACGQKLCAWTQKPREDSLLAAIAAQLNPRRNGTLAFISSGSISTK